MFVRLTHQPTNISGLAYVVVVAPYVHRPSDEYKKTNERMPFSVVISRTKTGQQYVLLGVKLDTHKRFFFWYFYSFLNKIREINRPKLFFQI
jgi:hypothetical protein